MSVDKPIKVLRFPVWSSLENKLWEYIFQGKGFSLTYLFWPCSESPLLNLLQGQMKFLRSRSLCWFQWLHHPVWERRLVCLNIWYVSCTAIQECSLNMHFACIQNTYNIIMYVCVLTFRDKLWWLKQNTIMQCVHDWINKLCINIENKWLFYIKTKIMIHEVHFCVSTMIFHAYLL